MVQSNTPKMAQGTGVKFYDVDPTKADETTQKIACDFTAKDIFTDIANGVMCFLRAYQGGTFIVVSPMMVAAEMACFAQPDDDGVGAKKFIVDNNGDMTITGT